MEHTLSISSVIIIIIIIVVIIINCLTISMHLKNGIAGIKYKLKKFLHFLTMLYILYYYFKHSHTAHFSKIGLMVVVVK